MNQKDRLCIIPPLPQNLMITGILIVLSLVTYNIRSPIGYQYYWSEFHLGIAVLALGFTAFHYAVYRDKLVLRFLFFPIKRIRLDKVTSATYFAPGTVTQGNMTEDYASILLTLAPCPAFSGSGDDVSAFERKHMLHTIRVKCHAKKAQDVRTSMFICLSHFGKTLNG